MIYCFYDLLSQLYFITLIYFTVKFIINLFIFQTEIKQNLEIKENQITVKKEIQFSNEVKEMEPEASPKDFQYILPINKKPHLRSKVIIIHYNKFSFSII